LLQVVQLFMLNDAISEVMSIVEQVLNGDRLEPFSASDIARKKSTADSDPETDTEASELIAGLFIGSARVLNGVSLAKVGTEGAFSSGGDNG